VGGLKICYSIVLYNSKPGVSPLEKKTPGSRVWVPSRRPQTKMKMTTESGIEEDSNKGKKGK
jgi:hypothetical protein